MMLVFSPKFLNLEPEQGGMEKEAKKTAKKAAKYDAGDAKPEDQVWLQPKPGTLKKTKMPKKCPTPWDPP